MNVEHVDGIRAIKVSRIKKWENTHFVPYEKIEVEMLILDNMSFLADFKLTSPWYKIIIATIESYMVSYTWLDFLIESNHSWGCCIHVYCCVGVHKQSNTAQKKIILQNCW